MKISGKRAHPSSNIFFLGDLQPMTGEDSCKCTKMTFVSLLAFQNTPATSILISSALLPEAQSFQNVRFDSQVTVTKIFNAVFKE